MMILVRSLTHDVWSVAPEGRLDLSAADAVQEAFDGLLNEGRARIVVDFSGVTYMASAGLRVLVLALRRARSLGGDVRLAAVNASVQQVLRMSGLDSIFTIHNTLPEAVDAIRSGTTESSN